MGFNSLIDTVTLALLKDRGFLWGANNPHLKAIWVTVRRAPKGLAQSFGNTMIGTDANPAAIICEVLENRRWGIGVPAAEIDAAAFTRAHQTLEAEGFGLSMLLVGQSEAETFISSVQDHIDAVVFVNPRTGQHSIRLIRDDYDPENLREVNPSNAKMVRFHRPGWGETVNEMKVMWTNPANEQEESVTLQDLGNISQQNGEVIQGTRNYYGVRDRDLAVRLCARELRKTSYPAASCVVRMLREAWDLAPGDVVRLVWPDHGILGAVMRVAEVDYGEPGDSYIGVTMSEDVFSLPLTAYSTPPTSGWVDESQPPLPMTYAHVFTLPAYFVARLGDTPVADLAYPEVATAVLAVSTQQDSWAFELLERTTAANGDLEWENAGVRQIMGRTVLAEAIPAEPRTTISTLNRIYGVHGPTVSGFVLIGSGEDEELCLIDSIDEDGLHLLRGVLDTTPKAHPGGAAVWFMQPSAEILDESPNADGELVEYKLLTQTSRATLPEEDAPIVSAVMSGRPHYPNRPANVKVQGVAFGSVEAAGLTNLSVTWARRNRVTEDAVVLPWDGPDVTPEEGQTTLIEVTDTNGVVLATHSDLTGTSYQVPLTDFGSETQGYIVVWAERDDFRSLQAHRLLVKMVPDPVRITEGGDYRVTEDGSFRVPE